MKRLLLSLLGLCALLATSANAEPPSALVYPETRSDPLVELIFGEEVRDPFRWLEQDPRQSDELAAWIEAQNALTESYLEQISARSWFEARMVGLLDYERFGIPKKAGERYFFLRSSGLLNQAQLFVQDGLDGTKRLLIDPNAWSEAGEIALASWEPSPDGSLVAFSVQESGSDWRRIRVIDVASGETLESDLEWVKYSRIAWVGNRGILYSRFPAPKSGGSGLDPDFGHAIYYHRLGTDQARDRLVHDTPGTPEQRHEAVTTSDGKWAIVTSMVGTDARHSISRINLSRFDRKRRNVAPIVEGMENEWRFLASVKDWLYFQTNFQAPNGQIVALNPNHRRPRWHVIVPEGEVPISGASIVGDRLVVETIHDAATKAQLFDLAGRPVSAISLASHGTASGFGGQPGDNETFYAFSSFNRPEAIYRLDLTTGETAPFALPDLTFKPDNYVIEHRFFTSRDGTRVPMFIVRSKGLAESGAAAPTLLYGYGGFDVSLTPGFSAKRMAWLEAGGVFALANVRGGGEFGKEWHEAGRGANKQNTFDDFIAAAEFLKSEGYTTENGLAIEGRSNGGLLVAAVINQRPDLFDAAHAAVGVMDMLRFDRWTAGRFWVDDYGSPAQEDDFRVLKAYSPYHNIAQDRDYPAILVTTADSDDRVVPAHSFKYTAALQAANLGLNPRLIRVESGVGHGSGKPTEKRVSEASDVLAFLAHHTGLSAELEFIQKKP